ncbi:hypothetical protein [Nitrolancea hollandica]|uniref:Uncharacterized protein n=1 Tax=Nitrolancea hollandica Lb TaxID=1129897 RepID=I4EF97_9BACT|nr:hypothetical protein [Nitrolancea hollandica]CCF83359.1 conserved hypothetical protein [Nitrolancea hollandica Lb]
MTNDESKKRGHIDLEMAAKIERLALQGWSATQIHDHLDRDTSNRGRVPHLRTVQYKVKDIRDRDKSRAWTLEDATPEEAAAVLPVLAAVIHETEGLVRSLTTAQVSYVVKIRAACPKLPPFDVFLLASLYVNRTAANEPVDDLDAYLAYQPWQGIQHWDRYGQAVERGWVRPWSVHFHVDDDGKVSMKPLDDDWLLNRMQSMGAVDKEDSDGE